MIDQVICEFDKALRTVFATAVSTRPIPGADLSDVNMVDRDRQHAAGLMRVNHCGEICAQALYQGQRLTSSSKSIREAMEYAAHEETEHLCWTERRLKELGGHKSFLNPLWYGGSLAIGVIAGRFGDEWNLGFLAETERQVEMHLEGHLGKLAEADAKSREIVRQMKLDESEHAKTAVKLGAKELPPAAKALMKLFSGAMTRTAYYI